jgi:DNA repair protein RecN (Recombination protein N)
MLSSLYIKNYALINEVEIGFQSGFSVITGETGAGKSILLGALGLVIGNRADHQVLQDKNKKCIVEAIFSIGKLGLQPFFEKNELDFEPHTTIRREITPSAKSRAFINDTPVKLHQLKELGEQLIDIHSQHQTLSLNNADFQLKVVDAFAQHSDLLDAYKSAYSQYKTTAKQLAALQNQEHQLKKDVDYIQFQFTELEEANLQDENEQIELELEYNKTSNAEEIKTNLAQANGLLQESENSVLPNLSAVLTALRNIENVDAGLKELVDRVNSSYLELKDVGFEIERFAEGVEYNPVRIEEINDRLNLIYDLQKKHQVTTIGELVAIKNELDEKLNSVSFMDEQLEKLTHLKTEQHKIAAQLAQNLSENRKAILAKIETQIATTLSNLAMPNAQLKIEMNQNTELSEQGLDAIQFLFAANKGGSFQPLNKVASGGELSRLMLAIKAAVAKLINLPTIIFDEIDTGVSGEVANKLANIMQKTAEYIQILSITHLPQVASKGNAHFMVYKDDSADQTISKIKVLSDTERVDEIAKMLSGEKLTDSAVSNARELLG